MARTIAIVEDERAIRENYAEAFVRQGYQSGFDGPDYFAVGCLMPVSRVP